jgi:S1-C subfamily serine protease
VTRASRSVAFGSSRPNNAILEANRTNPMNYSDVSDPTGGGGHQSPPPANQPDDDRDLLDAYSRAVVGVVERVSPSLLALSGEDGERDRGSGSGVIVSADGLALTNSHVVAGRHHLVAETSDGDRLSAVVVGDDPATDAALLRVRPATCRTRRSATRRPCGWGSSSSRWGARSGSTRPSRPAS